MSREALWDLASAAGAAAGAFLARHASCGRAALATASVLPHRLEELRGRSVLLATDDQLSTAVALLELDGLAQRVVLCTPDVSGDNLAFLVDVARAEVCVRNSGSVRGVPGGLETVEVEAAPVAVPGLLREGGVATEWVLLTSGTTGRPKLVAHTLGSLTGLLPRSAAAGSVWSTFYDIRRYGGLQIYLRAVLCGASLVLSDAAEPVAQFLARAGEAAVSHISGTPSHWRRALMSGAAGCLRPTYVRLSGEVADQPLLDALRSMYPDARVSHAFASTEAGVAFDVDDGLAGFPAAFVDGPDERRPLGIELRVADGTLRIRSVRNAERYLGADHAPLAATDGFVDTGDLVELVGDRYYFRGRRGGVINVGGQKVYPEEIESLINADPRVHASLVRARRNPITGAVVVADVVLAEGCERRDDPSFREVVKAELLLACRRTLAPYKVPAVLRIVPDLEMSAGGKLVRPNA